MTKKIALIVIISFFLNACNALKPEKVDARKVPTSAEERAKKNIKQGGGFNPGSLLGRGNTNFEFSSSNPMWRASLEILDFIPMSTVDYSGGMIISDWYTGDSNNANESIKISLL